MYTINGNSFGEYKKLKQKNKITSRNQIDTSDYWPIQYKLPK